MKHALSSPDVSDIYKTRMITSTQDELTGLANIQYGKSLINLRSIQEVSQHEMKFFVPDETKWPQYEEELRRFADKEPPHQFGGILRQPPRAPYKEIRITGVLILYFNGVNRVIEEDFETFAKVYELYLTKQKLSMD